MRTLPTIQKAKIVTFALFITIYPLYRAAVRRKQCHRAESLRNSRTLTKDHLKTCTDEEFRNLLRMDRSSFDQLVSKLGPTLQPHDSEKHQTAVGTIDSYVKVAAMLHYLGGGM